MMRGEGAMKRYLKQSDKAGMAPGSLMRVGTVEQGTVRARVVEYDPAWHDEWDLSPAGLDVLAPRRGQVRWIALDGVHDPALVQRVCRLHGIHDLIIEDVLNSEHQPKLDELDDGLFLIAWMPERGGDGELLFRSVNMVCGSFGVLSFVEAGDDPFGPVRERIRSDKSKLRARGPDYLAYSLLDLVVDRYFAIVEETREEIEALEGELISGLDADFPRRLQALRSMALHLRRSVRPMTAMLQGLVRVEAPVIQDSSRKYFEDVLDHMTAISDNVEMFREFLAELLELHLSAMNISMNRVVKLLTIFAALFMPLTFLTGLYGMNFRYMPMLDSRFGFAFMVLVLLLVVASMIGFFRWRRWL